MARKWSPLATKIVRSADTCDGRWRIEGTRITVGMLTALFLDGMKISRIHGRDYYPHLTRQQVEDALRFYARQPVRAKRRILLGRE